MKLIVLFTLLITSPLLAANNTPVSHIDIKRYSGTWFSLYSIPTRWDKGSRETTGKYTWNEKGYFDIVTTCKTEKGNLRSVNSKLFPSEGYTGAFRAQFIWPFKIDYWVIELADDYSYVVIGHPDLKMLFIMSRKKQMAPSLYTAITERCKAKGYDVSKLTSQNH